MNIFKKVEKMASDFLTNIEAKINSIIAAEDPEAVKAEIMADINTATSALTGRVSDLETALTDTVNHLVKGDVAAAQATASAPLTPPVSGGTTTSTEAAPQPTSAAESQPVSGDASGTSSDAALAANTNTAS